MSKRTRTWSTRGVHLAALAATLAACIAAGPSPAAAQVSWRQMSPAITPEARGAAAAVYDSRRGETVLFGGRAGSTPVPATTWIYRDGQWSARAVPGPAPRYGAAMAYDPGRGVAVLYGGFDAGQHWLNDTWEWDGTGWQQTATELAPPPPAPAWNYVRLDYDSRIHRVVRSLSGGCSSNTLVPSDPCQLQTDPCGGGAWKFQVYGRVPPAGGSWSDAWDAAKVGWPSTNTRTDYTLAYDSKGRRHLLFGGLGETCSCAGRPCPPLTYCGGGFADLRKLDGDGCAWADAPQGTSRPGARFGHGMVYDALRDRFVLFAGSASFDQGTNETWEYLPNAASPGWIQVSTTTTPPVRLGQAMVYDAARGKTVVFGGFGPTGALADTWEYPLSSAIGPARDNVTVLLRHLPIEGGIHVTTFDRFSAEPEFHASGEGYDRFAYFASDVGGFEAMRTRIQDPAYPVTTHTFEIDRGFVLAGSPSACTTSGGGNGFLLRFTYWDQDPLPQVRVGSAPLAPLPAGNSATWKDADYCLAPATLPDFDGTFRISVSAPAGATRDVYFREITLFRSNPLFAPGELPEAEVIDYQAWGMALGGNRSASPCASSPPQPPLGNLLRYDHTLAASCPAQTNMKGLPLLRMGNPGPGCSFSSCNGDDFAVMVDPGNPSGRFVGVLGKACTSYRDSWWLRPCAPDGPALVTVSYLDDSVDSTLLLERYPPLPVYPIRPGEPFNIQRRWLFHNQGSNAWRTQSILVDQTPYGGSGPAEIHLDREGPSPGPEVKVRQVSWSRTRVEVELPSTASVGAWSQPGWVRIRRSDNTLATGIRVPGTASSAATLGFEGSFEPSQNEPAPTVTAELIGSLVGGRGQAHVQADRPSNVYVDAVLTLKAETPSSGPYLSQDVFIRSVPLDATAVTRRQPVADIQAVEPRDGMLYLRDSANPLPHPVYHNGWTTNFVGGENTVSSRAQVQPLPTVYYHLNAVETEATPGDLVTAGPPVQFDPAHPVANRTSLTSIGSPPVWPSPDGVSLDRGPTDPTSVEHLWGFGKQLHAFHVRAWAYLMESLQTHMPTWFRQQFGCGPGGCAAGDTRNIYNQVRERYRSTVQLQKSEECYQDRSRCQIDNRGRVGSDEVCWNDPNVRAVTRAGFERLLLAVADDETLRQSLLGLQFLNEPSYARTADACYCEDCRRGFWHWLADRYGTVENLQREYRDASLLHWWDVDPPQVRQTTCEDKKASDPGCAGADCSREQFPCQTETPGCAGNANLCRDWLQFRNDSFADFVNEMAQTWRRHLVDRYPYVDRVGSNSVPLRSTVFSFDHLPQPGFVWPRNWQKMGSDGLDVMAGNNGMPDKPPSLQATMRDAFAPGKPYYAVEFNASISNCASWANAGRRIHEVGAESLASGLAGMEWLYTNELYNITGDRIDDLRDNPKWKEANGLGLWGAKLADLNARAVRFPVPNLDRVAVLVSDNAFAKNYTPDRAILDCGAPPAELDHFLRYLYGLPAVDKVVRNLGGYAFTFITEAQVLQDTTLLDRFKAVLMIGFEGDDLTGSMIYSNCSGGAAGCSGTLTSVPDRCLLVPLRDWVSRGNTLLVAWGRPLEQGSLDSIKGPCWGLDADAAVSYRPATSGANALNLVANETGTSDHPAGCVASGLCWSDFQGLSYGCYPAFPRLSSCAQVDGTANRLVTPNEPFACGGVPLSCPGAPTGITRHPLGQGTVYLMLDGFERSTVTSSSCTPAVSLSYTARLLDLALRDARNPVLPVVDTHLAVGPASGGCASGINEAWKNFELFNDGTCSGAVISLYNPYGAFDTSTGCIPMDPTCGSCDPAEPSNCPTTGAATRSSDVVVRFLKPGTMYQAEVWSDGQGPSSSFPVSTDGSGTLTIPASATSLLPGQLLVLTLRAGC